LTRKSLQTNRIFRLQFLAESGKSEPASAAAKSINGTMPPAASSGEVPLLAADPALLFIYAQYKMTVAISHKINYIASRE